MERPSGTGKSSFVTALANFLNYDVYDIEFSNVTGDSDLKLLLLETTPKSVVVIKDLDRFLMEKKSTGISLSGVLNFMEGILNSCCADEKIMVFTMTNCLLDASLVGVIDYRIALIASSSCHELLSYIIP
ncbi:hypothetical protein K1719_038226 [Acacia pycnantha]|nr:hypothetical protein K1719_038226 [Acacia pycnantha]